MSNEDKQNNFFLASTLLAYSITPFSSEDHPFRRDLVPHLTSLKSHRRSLGQTTSYTDSQLFKFGYTFYENGLYNDAEQLDIQVLESKKRVLGVEHPDTLTAMDNLAWTYSQQGRATEAEELQLRVLESRKRVLGVEHPHTLTAMGNLAWTYS